MVSVGFKPLLQVKDVIELFVSVDL